MAIKQAKIEVACKDHNDCADDWDLNVEVIRALVDTRHVNTRLDNKLTIAYRLPYILHLTSMSFDITGWPSRSVFLPSTII